VVLLLYSKIFDLNSSQIKTPDYTDNDMPPTSTSDNINPGVSGQVKPTKNGQKTYHLKMKKECAKN
jgi:hypothetical protein